MLQQLGNIAEIRSGYPFRGRVQADPDGDVAVVQMKNLDPATGLLDDDLTMTSGLGPKAKKYFLQPGDLLIQAKGFHNTSALFNVDSDAVAAIGLYVIRPRTYLVNSGYLHWMINHPRTQNRLRQSARGTRIPFITKRSLMKLEIPVPELTTQHKVAELAGIHQRQLELQQKLNQSTKQLVQGITWDLATESTEMESN